MMPALGGGKKPQIMVLISKTAFDKRKPSGTQLPRPRPCDGGRHCIKTHTHLNYDTMT